jgi:hypothetical protein
MWYHIKHGIPLAVISQDRPDIEYTGDLSMFRHLSFFPRSDLSALSVVSGYIFGLFIPLVTRFDLTVIPNITSLLLGENPIRRVISSACIQALPFALILTLSFIPRSSVPIAAVVFIRSALASFSCTLLALSDASTPLFILHSASGICAVYLLWACARCSYLFSQKKEPLSTASDLMRHSLYFIGLTFLTVFVSQVALAFV